MKTKRKLRDHFFRRYFSTFATSPTVKDFFEPFVGKSGKNNNSPTLSRQTIFSTSFEKSQKYLSEKSQIIRINYALIRVNTITTNDDRDCDKHQSHSNWNLSFDNGGTIFPKKVQRSVIALNQQKHG